MMPDVSIRNNISYINNKCIFQKPLLNSSIARILI